MQRKYLTIVLCLLGTIGLFAGWETGKIKVNGGTNATVAPLIISGNETNNADPYVLNNNGIFLDGVLNGDHFIEWGATGEVAWAAGTYRDEDSEFWYLHNNRAKQQTMTVTEAGRFGVNKLPDVMNDHSLFTGTGLNDMDVGGVFTLRRKQYFMAVIDGTGSPDTFLWATSFDNVNFTTNATTVPVAITATTLTNGVTVTWAAATGHTSADKWTFAGNPQIPAGTFTVNPAYYTEVMTATNYTLGAGFVDRTYQANDIDASAFVLLQTGTDSALYIGNHIKRNSVYLSIATPAQGATLVVEYWNGSAWTPITAAMGLVDLTSNLTQSGTITWSRNLLTGWTKDNLTVDEYVNKFNWVRLRSSTAITTAPTVTMVSPNGSYRLAVFASAFGATPSFYVDPNGDTYMQRKAYANQTAATGLEVVNLNLLRSTILASQQSIMYLRTNANITVAAHNVLDSAPAPGTTITTYTTNSVGLTQVPIKTFMTSNQVNVLSFPAGTYRVVAYGSVNSTVGGTVSRLVGRLFLRTAAGAATNYFTEFGVSPPLTTTANTLQEFSITLSTNAVCNTTDFLGLTMYATNSSATTRNISLAIEGAAASRVNLPLSIGTAATSIQSTGAGTSLVNSASGIIKSLLPGSGVTITDAGTNLTIASTATGGGGSNVFYPTWSLPITTLLGNSNWITMAHETVPAGKRLQITRVRLLEDDGTTLPATTVLRIYDATAASTLLATNLNWNGNLIITNNLRWYARIENNDPQQTNSVNASCAVSGFEETP